MRVGEARADEVIDDLHAWFATQDARIHMITFPNVITDESLENYFNAIHTVYRRLSPRQTFIMDIRQLARNSVTAVQRRRYAEFEQEVEALDREYIAGAAIIAGSSLQRGLVTALFWLKPPVYAYSLCRTNGRAMEWCRARLSDPT